MSDKKKEDLDKLFDDLFKTDNKPKDNKNDKDEKEASVFDDDFLRDLFKNDDNNTEPQTVSKIDDEKEEKKSPIFDDDFFNELFSKKDDRTDIGDDNGNKLDDKKDDKKDDDNFDWLKDLIDEIDREEQEKKKNAPVAPPVPLPPAPITGKPGKPSFLSKIKDKPRPPAPPPHVRDYGSGKKIVHIPQKNDYGSYKEKSFFAAKKLHLSILGTMYFVLIVSGWFVFKGYTPSERTMSVKSEVVMQNVYSGDKILIDTKAVSQNGKKVIERGYIDSHISNLMYRLLKPGETAIDVGAGFGYYTLYLSRIVGEQGKVYAFEARKSVAELLDASTRINKMNNVKVFNSLVFSYKSHVIIDTTDSQHRSNFGISNIIIDDNNNTYINAESKEKLDSATLDQLLSGVKNVSMLNINTHGSELNVLLGAKRLISESPRIKIITTWSKYSMSKYINVQSAVSQLMDNGFRFWFIKPSSGNLVELTRLEHIMQVENGRFLIAKTLN